MQSINDQPVISRLTPKPATEGMAIVFPVQVTDVDTVVTNLEITVSSGSPTVIPNANILLVFGDAVFTNHVANMPANQFQMSLTPNVAGTAVITVQVTDHGLPLYPAGDSNVFGNFTLNVSPVNHKPVLSDIPSQATPANSTTTNITFTVNDPDAGQTITLSAVSSDQTLVKDSSIRFVESTSFASGSTVTRHVNVTTEAGVQGTVNITLVASDNGASPQKGSTTFSLSVRPSRERTFANSAPIVIRDNTTASPYPSVISAGSLVGSVNLVKVALNAFAHDFPSDVEMLLVSPDGRRTVLMGKAGDGTAVTNLTLRFDDGASTAIPQNATLTSAIYKPANYGNFTFATPAPAKPYGTTLSALNGGSASGDWQLFIADDLPGGPGVINGGWSLALTTQPIIVGLSNITTRESVSVDLGFTILEESFAPTSGFAFGFTSTNTAVVGPNDVTFRGSGTNWTLTVTPEISANGPSEITVLMTNADFQVVSNKFTVTVTPVDYPPSITTISNLTIQAGSASPLIPFTYSDDDTAQKDLKLNVQSDNPTLIPTNNIIIVGGTLQVVPIGILTGNATITLTVTDNGGFPASTKFTVTVIPAPGSYANTNVITTPLIGSASPYPSTVAVSGERGTVVKATVTLLGLSHTYPSDIEMVLVGPHGQSTVLMANAGGGAPGISNIRLTLDDAAAASLPFGTGIANGGVYKPTKFDPLATFPAPAPAAPYGTSLSVFNGTDPNGTWSLYVLDDTSPDSGSVSGGWLLVVATTVPGNLPPVISGLSDQPVPVNRTLTEAFTVTDDQTDPTNIIVAATTSGLGTVAVSGVSSNRTLTFTPSGATGQATVSVTASDGTLTSTNTIRITVGAVSCNLDLTSIADQTVKQNASPQVPFTILNPTTTNLTATGSADNSALVSKVDIGGTGVDRTANIALVPTASGTSLITITVSDGFCTNSTLFQLTVTPNQPPVLGAITNQTTAVNVPAVVTLSVSDPDTALTDLQFSFTSSNTKLVTGVNFAVTGNNVVATVNLGADQSGQATVTISVFDGSTKVSQSFLLTVNPATPPTLSTSRSGNSFTISWGAEFAGFTLESKSSLTDPTWTPVPGPVNNSVTLTIGTSNQFFRLMKP